MSVTWGAVRDSEEDGQTMAERHIPTVLGTGLRLVGSIESEGSIEVHGKLEINLQCDRLDMSPAAEIIGNIVVKHALIRGRIIGNISADTLRVAESARIEGDIVAKDVLEIAEGARCVGRIKSKRVKRPEPEMPQASRQPVTG